MAAPDDKSDLMAAKRALDDPRRVVELLSKRLVALTALRRRCAGDFGLEFGNVLLLLLPKL
jgi:hypothetical protein